MKAYLKFAIVISFFAFSMFFPMPLKVKAADYSLPAGANINTYLSITYPTFADFLNFAVYNGLSNFTYDYRSGSSKIDIYYRVNDTLMARVTYENFSLSHSSLDSTSYGLYSGTIGASNLSDLFSQYYADYPNIPLYESVREAADLNADSVRKFRLILFAFSALLFVVLSRRF